MSTQTSYISAGPYHDIISGVQLILSFSDGVVRLTGAEGAGKSSLLDALLDALQEDGQLALLFKLPLKSPQELHNHLTRELALPANMGFRKALARFITARPRDKQHLILLFDDAEQMDEETLLELFQLRDVTNNGQALISLVVFGLPSLDEHLAAPALADITKDAALRYELNPLSLQELEAFCTAAIQTRNLKIPRPAARTLEYLLAESGGLPGPLLQLLPNMVAEPEIAPRATAAAPTPVLRKPASPEANSQEPETEATAAAPKARRVSLSLPRLQLPFSSTKLRQGLYGGAAIAATVAAAFLLYPQLAPLLQKTEPQPQTVASTPAPAVSEPVPAPAVPEPVAATEPAPAAESTSTQEVAASIEPAPVQSETAPSEAGPAPEPEVASAAEPAQPQEASPAPAIATLTPPEPAVVTPPPASSSVSVVPAFPVANLQDLTPEALEEVVRSWLSAWQNKDLDGYFGAYHTDFAPLYQGTRAAWRENRSSSITRPSAISIALEDFSVSGESVVGTHVSFWIEYHTATYADRTLKELVISHDLDGSLRILQEINRQVTTLTPSEFLNGPDTSTIATAPAPAPAAASATPAAPTEPAARPTVAARATQTLVGPPIQHSASITMDSNAVAASSAVSAEQTSELRDFLGSWLNAWQQQDVDSYLRHYHPDFRASSFASRSSWEADRTRKITRPLAIQIHLQNLQVVAATQSLGEVELLMEYHSSYYADRTRKAMRLERSSNGNWQITDERNLQVDALPLARLIPGSTLTLRGGFNTIFERAL